MKAITKSLIANSQATWRSATSVQGLTLLAVFLLLSAPAFAAGGGIDAGKKAIDNISTSLSGYFDSFKTLCYIVAGICALFGGLTLFFKWNGGDQGTKSAAALWFGSMVFMALAPTLISAFFL